MSKSLWTILHTVATDIKLLSQVPSFIIIINVFFYYCFGSGDFFTIVLALFYLVFMSISSPVTENDNECCIQFTINAANFKGTRPRHEYFGKSLVTYGRSCPIG